MARLINAFEQFFDGAGDPLVNGKLWFYTSGSSTIAKNTFADSDESIPNTNPVILTGDGRAPNIFGTGTYRVILTNSSDVQIIQRDPIGGDGAIAFGADWISTQVYSINDVVRDDGEYWVSLIASNQNIRPSTDGGGNWIRWPDDILNATIIGGTIDNTIIGGATPAAGSFTTADINGGTIDGAAVNSSSIGATTPSTGDFTTLTATALTATTPCLPDRYISGLIGSQAADTDHDITISTGAARDSTGAYDLRLASAMTKQIDAAWAAGDATGGLDTGTVANSTEYWYFLIRKDSDGSIDVLISTSYSSPTMPSGYTYRSLPVHWAKTDGSANIITHRADEMSGGGVRFQWDSPPLDIDLSNTLSTTARSDAISTPAGIKTFARLHVRAFDAAVNHTTFIYDPDLGDVAPNAGSAPLYTIGAITGDLANTQIDVYTDTSSQIRAVTSISTLDQYKVATLGFEWSRR